ncbi:unnamed protein product [Cochlearia groenlandica]
MTVFCTDSVRVIWCALYVFQEVEKEYNGAYSVHIYSVQASIPKDPAAIWNTEFAQAELFRQPSTTDNCVRDNRFSGISNSFMKRNIEGATANATALRTESAGATRGHCEKSGTGSKGSLKNMRGLVPVKTEDDSPTIEVKNHDHSEAQRSVHVAENKGDSDDVHSRRAFKNDPEMHDAHVSQEMKTDEPQVSEENRQNTASANTSDVRRKYKYMASPVWRRSMPLVLKLNLIL